MRKKAQSIIFVRIAGYSIKINFHSTEEFHWQDDLFSTISRYYKGFIISKVPKPNFIIHVSNLAFLTLKKKVAGADALFNCLAFKKDGIISVSYYISFYELSYLITSSIQEHIYASGGFFLHASSVIIKRAAHIFIGKSGSGKSTISHLLSEKHQILSDDTIIIKKVRNSYYAYQSPLIDKNSREIKKINKGYPVKGIYKLFKHTDTSKKIILNRIEKFNGIKKYLIYSPPMGTADRSITLFCRNRTPLYDLYFEKHAKKIQAIMND